MEDGGWRMEDGGRGGRTGDGRTLQPLPAAIASARPRRRHAIIDSGVYLHYPGMNKYYSIYLKKILLLCRTNRHLISCTRAGAIVVQYA